MGWFLNHPIFSPFQHTTASSYTESVLFGDSIVTETFGGSLPAFVAAFLSQKPLSEEEADEIRKLIDRYEEAGK